MEYYDHNDDYNDKRRRRRLWALLWLLFYLGACLFLMFRAIDIWLPDPLEDAIIVTFEPLSIRAGAQQQAVDAVPSGQMPEQALTTEREDAPELPVAETGQQTPEPAPEPVREVNQRALFPGQTASSGSQSNSGSGGGVSSGTGFSLEGRNYAETPPKPVHPDPTMTNPVRVVMRISVNAEGHVTNAVYEPVGSTIDREDFKRAAREAAMKYLFVPNDAALQTGTITVTFLTN